MEEIKNIGIYNYLKNINNISNPYQSTNFQQRQLDIKKITEELDEPIFS